MIYLNTAFCDLNHSSLSICDASEWLLREPGSDYQPSKKATLYRPHRFLSLLTNFGFKSVLGNKQNKHILIHFLNSILEGHFIIEDISYLPTEKIGATIEDRGAYYDLMCQTSNEEVILIEMQNLSQQFFSNRLIFYSSWLIQEQAKRGRWDYDFSAMIIIGVCFFELDDSNPNYLSTKVLMDKETNIIWNDKLQFVQVEIPKFKKNLDQCKNSTEKWLFLLQNMHHFEEIPAELNDEILLELLKKCDLSKLSPKKRKQATMHMLTEEKFYNFTNFAKIQGEKFGFQRGHEIGREEGREEGEAIGLEKGEALGLEKGQRIALFKTVETMLEKGYPWKVICEITGVSEKEFLNHRP